MPFLWLQDNPLISHSISLKMLLLQYELSLLYSVYHSEWSSVSELCSLQHVISCHPGRSIIYNTFNSNPLFSFISCKVTLNPGTGLKSSGKMNEQGNSAFTVTIGWLFPSRMLSKVLIMSNKKAKQFSKILHWSVRSFCARSFISGPRKCRCSWVPFCPDPTQTHSSESSSPQLFWLLPRLSG